MEWINNPNDTVETKVKNINERVCKKISKDLKSLTSILDVLSEINESENIINDSDFVPKSYKKFLTAKKDFLWHWIWFKIKSVFSLYEVFFAKRRKLIKI